MERVKESRAQGYAFSKGPVTEGVGIIAIASSASAAGAQFAVGVGGLIEQLERSVDEVVPQLRALLAGAVGHV